MLMGILTGPDAADVRRQMEKGSPYVDGFEWRLDLFSQGALSCLTALKMESGKPSLFTWRSCSEKVKKFLHLEPDYCDLDLSCPKEWIEEIAARYPKMRILISYHNYECTPSDLEAVLSDLQSVPAYAYKIAVKAHSTIDMLRLLNFVKRSGSRLSGISMGPYGQTGRILGPIVGNFFDYAMIEKHPLLEEVGLLSAEELQQRYRYRSLGPFTSIYALLGDPVETSISNITHNATMEEKRWNAVYLKLRLKSEELDSFFHLAAQLPFQGFSVTMPLKESIIPFAAEVETPVLMSRALNTLTLRNGRWVGSNTDGPAAAALIGPLHGKRCIIVGAGGAALAIAYELLRRQAHVVILNRTLEKAKAFTEQYGGEAHPLTALDEVAERGYDILVHATSVGFHDIGECLVQERHLLPGKIIFEIVAKRTFLCELAERKKCHVILGSEHFELQAALQFQSWGS